jgi:hypothetical protein
MPETRQQRRAAARAAIKAGVTTRVQASRSVQEMWRTYASTILVPRLGCSIDDPLIAPLREAFYGGAAAMFELVIRVAPAEVDEDAGVGMLQRLEDELRVYASGLQ